MGGGLVKMGDIDGMRTSAIAATSLAAITLVGIAVVTGFKDSGQVVNSTADLFITGLTVFGTFMAVIVLAIVGKIIIGLFRKK